VDVIGAERMAARRAKVEREATRCPAQLAEVGQSPEDTPHLCTRPRGHTGLHFDEGTRLTWGRGLVEAPSLVEEVGL